MKICVPSFSFSLAFASALSALVLGSGAAEAGAPWGPDAPFKIRTLRYAVSPSQVHMSAQKLALVSAHVQNAVAQDRIDGAVLLVARHGRVVLHESYGKRDGNWGGAPASNPVMPLDGIFDLQSVTKLFTALLAMNLHESGELDIDAPVADYLPSFGAGAKAEMKVRDLLRFMSGENVDMAAPLVGVADPWGAMLAEELAYTPSSMVLYSDLGYRLLGRVVEVAGGAGLDVLTKSRITDPLGMRHTGFRPLATMAPHASRFVGTGYSERGGALRYMRGEVADDQDHWIEEQTGSVTGCDGAFSTAWDLGLFGQMFLNRGARIVGKAPSSGYCTSHMHHCHIEELLSPASVEAMMSLQTTDALGAPLGLPVSTVSWLDDLLFENKGYAWELASLEEGAHVVTGSGSSHRAVSKIGAAGTFLMVDPDPERDLVVVLLTNHGLPSQVGPDGISVDGAGNVTWPGYENMLNGIAPNVMSDLVADAMTDL